MECYLLTFSKYSITQKHSVRASNRYVFRYRKLAKEINTLIDCFCLKTKQLIQFSNIEAFSFARTKGFLLFGFYYESRLSTNLQSKHINGSIF